ncbi:MAG: nitrous oxide reductase family maturation protein NosD [Gemmatimonadota bacterium]
MRLAHAASRLLLPLILAAAPPLSAAPARASTGGAKMITAGTSGDYRTIGDALAAAADGDTVLVLPGVYREHLEITRAVVLLGRPGAVLDGGGEGTVLTLRAPAVVSGLRVRGSGSNLSREDAGIMVLAADGVRIEGNELEDVLFGIYLKESADPQVRDNVIRGKALPVAQRGDGIRLWYCRGGRVEGNRLWRVRDLVIWFTRELTVTGNEVSDSRYGLHYMYSDHNHFTNNRFLRNRVGAFVMYSKDIELRDNVFAEAAGASGIGLGLKDTDGVRAEGNVFVASATGISLDNSPSTLGSKNVFRNNVVAWNDVGIHLLPAVAGNQFEENRVSGNLTPVAVSGGGDALANEWSGNYWSEYAGLDEDGDGIGDTPFVHARLADDLFVRHVELRLFELSPAVATLDILGEAFPLLKPRPVVVDPRPLSRPPGPEGRGSGPGADVLLATAWLGAGVAAALVLARLRGVRSWP